MEIKVIGIEKPDPDMNMILGQSHFIKTVEDIHEAIVTVAPQMKFGLAFNESSGPCLVRYTGNDQALIELAKKNALNIGAGHSFIIFMSGGFPINILNALKQVPEVCGIYCATANPVQVVLAETEQGRGILGVIDGGAIRGAETDKDIEYRRSFLRKIGYKF
ncbi:MAG: adenosine-specific kinase [Ignavibacteriales bacterium]